MARSKMDKYLFTPGGNVSPKDFYTEERGFGFITEQVMENVPHLMLPELNGGSLVPLTGADAN